MKWNMDELSTITSIHPHMFGKIRLSLDCFMVNKLKLSFFNSYDVVTIALNYINVFFFFHNLSFFVFVLSVWRCFGYIYIFPHICLSNKIFSFKKKEIKNSSNLIIYLVECFYSHHTCLMISCLILKTKLKNPLNYN